MKGDPWDDGYPAERPVALVADVALPKGGVPTTGGAALIDSHPAPLQRVDWHQLWSAETDEEWILEPLLPARRQVVMYSAPKVGKSLLMLEIAAAVSNGRTVLGTTPPRPYRVLYVDFENDLRGDVRPRLQAMGYGPDDLSQLDYLSFPTIAALDSERGGRELITAATGWGDEIVVIDTVSRGVAGEENSNDTWLAFYRHTGLPMRRLGMTLLRLDHSGKDSTRGQRGGSAKGGDVDAVWRLTKVTDSVLRLDLDDSRMPIAEKALTLHRETTRWLHHRVDERGRAAAFGAKLAETATALDAAGAAPELGERAARELLRGRGFTVSNNVLREAIRVRRVDHGETLPIECADPDPAQHGAPAATRPTNATVSGTSGCAETETAQHGAPTTGTAPRRAPHHRVAQTAHLGAEASAGPLGQEPELDTGYCRQCGREYLPDGTCRKCGPTP